jgi:hypothetical protein
MFGFAMLSFLGIVYFIFSSRIFLLSRAYISRILSLDTCFIFMTYIFMYHSPALNGEER